MRMTRILITNDDGIHSDGLIKLEEALKELGDVYVVAPASEMSGASHSLTLARPLRIRQMDDPSLGNRRHPDRLRHARAQQDSS